jgi:hypothetical protein
VQGVRAHGWHCGSKAVIVHGRGILIALLIGTIMWALIILLAWRIAEWVRE